jgi:hypothetical protein
MSVFSNPASRSAADAADYIEAVLGLLGPNDPLEVLERTPAALRRLREGMSEREVAMAEAPGKWSVRHVLRHVADSEVVWGWRLRLVLAQDRPALTGYDQDLWADRLLYDQADPDEALEEFAILRRGHLQLLGRVPRDALLRVGVHAERGEESVAHMTRLYAGHDLLHLRQLARIRGVVAGNA